MNEDNGSHETLIGVALLAGLLLIALVLALIAGLEWYLNPASKLSIVERRDLVQGLASAGQALAVFLTGAVGLIGLFFTWQNTSQARESTRQTLELTERGQITERFTRAIDQLGATDDKGKKKLEIRLGGIYGLERIDKESPERAYHGTVMEVLTAYVRENAPWRPKASNPPEGGSVSDSAFNEGAPPLDIRAILDILMRREEEQVPKEYRVWFDLRETDLREAFLPGANLREAFLRANRLTNPATHGCRRVGGGQVNGG